MRIVRSWLGLCMVLWLCVAPVRAMAQAASFDRRASAELDRLVRDVCRREIVVLGEDANHGGGRTLEIKVELAKRLVERCGFGGIVFESSVYAALDLERRLAQGTATEDDVVDAAGQLWFRAREAQPLPPFLLQAARDGRLRIGGMDIQPVARPGRYTGSRLASELAAVLDASRQAACDAEIQRHNRHAYDDEHPFDDAAQARLRACIDAVRAATQATGTDTALARMAEAYGRYLDMAMTGDGDVRERAMFDLLMWHRERWPPGTKLLVWCATVHGAKALHNIAPAMHPMGADLHARFGKRAAVIGFTALSGAFGQGGAHPPLRLPETPPLALETRALEKPGELRYLDAKRLARMGIASSRPINYRSVHAADWSKVLNGLLVLREERPITPLAR
ncbi:erythromycin esterase family protein [Lysobacter brunescens]|uniref:Erythromycin esterase family protein n=1 Tax=Lysobacter brunescens TaxID=262323 RepID=A0ABW2YB60_9GAMM